MKKLYILSICTLITALTYAQPVNYTVTVTQVQWFESGIFGACQEAGTEEYTALVWFDDNLNGTNTGGNCIQCNNNGDCTNNTNVTLGTRTNTCAETVNLIFNAWEDDRGGRCNYNINGGIFDTGLWTFWKLGNWEIRFIFVINSLSIS